MITLSIRTDSDMAELAMYRNGTGLAKKQWPAARGLSSQIVDEISKLAESCHLSFQDIEGLIVYQGPGSFTGLRIGVSVANSIAYALSVPIVASNGESWVETGFEMLQDGRGQTMIMPEYGHEPNVTISKTN